MSEINDMVLSQMLVKQGLLNMEELRTCMQLQKEKNISLEKIVKDENLLTEDEMTFLKNSIILGKDVTLTSYLLKRKLGEGGMGSVYKAIQRSLDRPVAFKLLDPELGKNKQFVKRFSQEAKLLAKLDHPNIVKGIDFGQSGNIYYYIMEYLEGYDVAKIVKDNGPLSLKHALVATIQMAKALEHAQAKKLVHRDIKPENIFICSKWRAKLCDLGLAKWKSSNLTTHGTIIGTPHYCSPEQAKGKNDVDIRSDIYSLGASFYFMLTGKPPYEGEKPVVVYSRHISDPPPDITKEREDLPQWVNKFIQKAMAKKVAERIQSPSDIIKILEVYYKEICQKESASKAKNKQKKSRQTTSTVKVIKKPSVTAKRQQNRKEKRRNLSLCLLEL